MIIFGKIYKGIKISQEKVRRYFKKEYIAILLIVVALIFIVRGILFVMDIKLNINLNKYVEVNFDGYDGYGQATVSIDWEEIERQHGAKLSYTKKAKSKDIIMTTLNPKTAFMQECISIDLNQDKNLGNGDKVTCECSVNMKELSSYLNCNITAEPKVVKVSGLEGVNTFNPFEELSVTFSGREPYGDLQMEYKGDLLSVSDFHSDKESELKNDDKITIDVDIDVDADNIEDVIKTYGMVPSVTKKEYIVSGLSEDIATLAQVDSKTQESIRQKAEEVIRSYSATGREQEVNTMHYVGCYLQVDMENPECNQYGVIYQIVPIETAWKDPGYLDIIQYYDVQFESLIFTTDNSCKVDLERHAVNYFNTLVELKNSHQGIYNNQYDIEWKIDNEEQYSATSVINKNTDRLCEYSSTRQIKDSDVMNYLNENSSSYNFPGNRTVIQMMINEMYALKGYQFADKELQAYFNQKSWYRNIQYKTADMNVILESMSTTEQENVTLLEKYK